jgi:hypothetical protein
MLLILYTFQFGQLNYKRFIFDSSTKEGLSANLRACKSAKCTEADKGLVDKTRKMNFKKVKFRTQ